VEIGAIMIIDGHAHASGDYLTPETITKKLDENNADKVILVPGELNSKKNYALPDLARIFPKKNVAKFFNVLTKIAIRLTGDERVMKAIKRFGADKIILGSDTP